MTSDKIKTEWLERDFISSLIPKRKKYSHKGHYGHVLVIAGSRGKTGAAMLAAEACLRAGAGLVTIGVPESLADVFQSRVTEEMTLVLPDKGDGTISRKAEDAILDFLREKADLLAIGPGIGVSPDTEKIVKALIRNSEKPLVIDADGINVLQGNTDVLKQARSPLVLTPHPGEMVRLLEKGRKKKRISSMNRIHEKKNLRIIDIGTIKKEKNQLDWKKVEGGLLLQEKDEKTIKKEDFKVVSKVKPNEWQLNALEFAWKVVKHVKSNAIVITKDKEAVGIGAGQMSRVDAVELAIKKGGEKVEGSVLSSDAFFPFRDSIDAAAKAKITAIIEPGGSIRDQEVINAADEQGLVLIFTGYRRFKH